MQSAKLNPGAIGQSIQYNKLKSDARGAANLLAHQVLGTLALGTNASNNQTITLTVNGTAITVTAVTSLSGAPAGSFLIQASAALTASVLLQLLRTPMLTNSNQKAFSNSNAQLLNYIGFTLNGATTIGIWNDNSTVNAPNTSLSVSTTITSGSWTANTMALYVEAGVYWIGNTRYVFSGGISPTITAPSSHPRIDVLSIDTSGNLNLTTGTENASPVVPAYPSGQLVLCEVWNVVSETAIYNNDNQQPGQGYVYNDIRPFLVHTVITAAAQIADGVITSSKFAVGALIGDDFANLGNIPGGAGVIPSANLPSFQPPTVNQNGATTYSLVTASGTQTIAHGLGVIPKNVRINALGYVNNGGSLSQLLLSITVYNGTTQSSDSYYTSGAPSTDFRLGDLSSATNSKYQVGVVTFDSTNIYIAWTKTSTPSGTYQLLWEAQA